MLNPTYKLHNINMLWQYFVDLKIAERHQVRKLSCHVLSRELCFYFQQKAGVISVSISHVLFQWHAAVS
ncbi:hypothetical protein EIW75_06605 [Salmonella enterica subsp. enterica serovar Bergen]|nr:hypothetical protein LFZ3_15805 [Salmonella enterica subsp. enterica serovar Bergen str. ST350]EAN4870910.1 hypothetical protein [Salmonella enterica subsp. enterica serovar Bergen]EAO6413886.1 hypothetical protein [Salmonella enterica]ECI3140970.1 hypothetical protein [Salmonella enterica subsp. enterica]MIX28529.1 hypothetical protein [Salmonella enterica subsp. enterica serovar Livingstone]